MDAKPHFIEPALVNNTAAAETISPTLEDLRQHIEELEIREAYYRQIVEEASDLIYRTDPAGYLVYLNPIAARLLGFEEEELLGRRADELVHPEHRRAMQRAYLAQLRDGQDDTYTEFPVLSKSGREVWIGQRGQTLRTDGCVVGYQAVARDVTDRVEARRESADREARMRLLYQVTSQTASVERQLYEALSLTCDLLGLEAGVVSRIEGDEFSIVQCFPIEGDLLPGQSFGLAQTYCGATAEHGDVVALEDVSKSDVDVQSALRVFGWESYIGTPIRTGGTLYGTLSFGMSRPRQEVFRESDFDLLRLLAQWAGDILLRWRSERALRESEVRYRLLAEKSTDMISRHAPNGVFLYASQIATDLLGYDPEELLGHTIYEYCHETDVGNLRTAFHRSHEASDVHTAIYRARRKDGDYVWFESTSRAVREQSGDIEEVVLVSRDVSLRKRAEEALKDSEERFRALSEAAFEGILISEDGILIDCNRQAAQLFGYEGVEDMVGLTLADLSPSDANGMTTALERGDDDVHETQAIRKNGDSFFVEVHGRQMPDEKRHVRVTAVRDVTARKDLEDRLVQLAYFDPLTNLPNRRKFHKLLEARLEMARNTRQYDFAVLFIDLDRFKLVNDSLGHQAGDDLLKSVAGRLQSALREGDVLARLSGDEFSVIANGLQDQQVATVVARRLLDRLKRPFSIAGHEIFVAGSVGIAAAEPHHSDAEHLLGDADAAMYAAKNAGGLCSRSFDSSMKARTSELFSLESDLRRALTREELTLHYQPILSLDSLHLAGFEALVRWQHPARGTVMPNAFIPHAEDIGLILKIDEWVIAQAARQATRWDEVTKDEMTLIMNVNCSNKTFLQADFLRRIREILIGNQLLPARLAVEITERVLMEDVERALDVLQELRDEGVLVCIDDFGTGYSSLDLLHKLPIDTLKIARTFVERIEADDRGRSIVQAVVDLARSIDVSVIAEGIETHEQLEFLQSIGCDFGQGYLFSRPVELSAATELILRRMQRFVPD